MGKGEKVGKFWFSPTVPKEVRDSVETTLLKYQFLIPAWCNEVRIFWDVQGEDTPDGLGTAAAYIEVSYAYRYASIFICPAFLNEETEDREERLKHELFHIVSAPLISYIREVSQLLEADDTTTQIIIRDTSEKVESMTEDLVLILKEMENFYTKNKKTK